MTEEGTQATAVAPVDATADPGGQPQSSSVALEGVRKRFGELTAVDGIDLEVGRGEFLTLLGPSGCGKTTTLRLIAGFEMPDEGVIGINGEDVAGLPSYKRPVNTVFQQYALFPHLSVEKNIGYGLRHGGVPKAEVASRVAEMMRLMEIPDVGDRRPAQLSGGQQQRVALARALVMRPAVLLLDEPLGSLDYKLRKGMQFELKRIHRDVGTTFIYVTHDQDEAMTMSDRIAVMNAGHIEGLGTPEDVFDRPRTSFVAGFVGDTNLLEGTVVESRGGTARVDLGELGVVGGGTYDRLEAGERVRVSIRPTDVAVTQSAEQETAMVQDSVLVGGHVEMKIVGGAEELIAHVPRSSGLAPGENVRLSVESERIRIFAES
ncbi:MAG: ABC transporter ATP-binding protein [Solirubrobacterales bacterium]|nr:ABC transporter ATP-binding protein [Solirubrobacterales bacterium]